MSSDATISLDDSLLCELERVAEERGVTVAALVREAIEEKLAELEDLPSSVGIIASGHTDAARRSGDERPEPRPWR